MIIVKDNRSWFLKPPLSTYNLHFNSLYVRCSILTNSRVMKRRFVKENLFCLGLHYRYQSIRNDVSNLVLLYSVIVNTNMYSRH